ncbi:MAG: GNAT family N-acetyltransferase [Desulfomonilaceae bacterium]|nr:GNAT family N-acetyltransferase [Desulfomonilaceae bacterium]
MNAAAFSIRRMERNEIDLAIDWAEAEGWNPGVHDAECFYAADPNGFLIGLLDDKPVGMVSAVAYGESYGFMGFYMVKPEVRNRTYGVQLWDAGLRYLENRCIGLDSVRPDLVSHKKPEFKPAYTNYRFRWTKGERFVQSSEISEVSQVPFSLVTVYDRKVFGFSRENFLKCWISRPGSRALGIIRDDELAAYGVVRQCREGFKIGPLFADNAQYARAVFEALTREVKPGANVYLDTPERNPEAVRIAQSYGITEVFRTTRMYNGEEPAVPLDKWFGVTSFELG